MPRLAIDRDFLDDYSKLEKSVQSAVKETIDKFAEHTHAGLHLEKIQKAKDDRIRTIRIDQFWRGVVLAPDSGDTYSLIRVLPHDKAIDYAAGHKFTVNQALGVVEVRNETALEQIQPALELAASKTGPKLLARVSDADLARLGIDSNTMVIARLLSTEAELTAMEKMIPEAQYNALFGPACGQTPEEVWAEVSQYAPSEPVDTGNVVKAMERTSDRVVFVESNDELERILEHPFAAWRIFLHPAQRKIAYAPRYAGPAQVTGGAGTGKTVTALHRAAHLARHASEELSVAGDSAAPVLLTTFTRNLADASCNAVRPARRWTPATSAGRSRSSTSTGSPTASAEQARGTRPAIIEGKELFDALGNGSRRGSACRSPRRSSFPRVGAGDPQPRAWPGRAGLPDSVRARFYQARRSVQGPAPPGLAG